MVHSEKSAGKTFPLVFTAVLICLVTAAFIPGVMGASAVNLGSAGNYAILAKSGITTTGTTTINGNIGVSPIAATAMTGFALSMDPSNQFSRSPIVNGGIYAANYASPTPATLTAAISDMETAYTDAAGRAPSAAAELYAGNLGGKTLEPGVYKWSTGVLIPSSTALTLDAKGNGGAVWIFQIAGDLTMDSASRIILAGGANADNVYWQVAGPTGVAIGSGAHAEGNILSSKAITMNSGASLNGRALAQTAVTLIANTVSASSPSSVPAQSSGGTGDNSLNGFTDVTATQTLAPGQTATPVQTSALQKTPTPVPTRTQPISSTITKIVKGDSVIYQADVTGTETAGLVITGTVVSGPGQGIGQPSGIVYQYIDLGPGKDIAIDHAVISYTVPVSWLESNQIAPQNLVLNRLDGNAWTALPTTFVRIENGQAYYTATTPAFSRVAVTGGFTPADSFVPFVYAVAPTSVIPEMTATQAQLAPTLTPTPKSSVPLWLPAIAMIGALVTMAVLTGRKRKNS